ncbi:carbonic anhydrase family protein [Achromobacter mucicolens]|uniref:Carbonic anhydrase family protein n=1 Tax=Achromobacter mucicolens TaxID=1389922 RepID=A0ABD4YTD7_9BURK|nr:MULTISPECIES: carbonic anhydrase family protein [Achromobacter]MCU6616984.1 carbonic anhydrase family protein [Achromobacter mucicolens]MDG9968117.1 carbonic anhydrase family protein [Achromobacter mucicolens]MDH1177644.1 carbonic anhydrase family protein [Achromobacter mucicolens]MDH1522351.1 carbonic anhydrase family protein [Achromobacter mucicolens]WBX90979.1 carbonic anhydrase family protein [Achromobacter mucicolens]
MAGHPLNLDRRGWLKAGVAAGTAAVMAGVAVAPNDAQAASLSQAQRDAMTPDQVIDMMKRGNARFRAGKPQKHDYLAQKRSSALGQYPAAVILSCIDSRAPAEIILDTGIGETFNGRIAGNISNNDLLGSMEFACAAAGAKVILVMGHTACGAVAGAIDNVQLGHLTGLLDVIKPAVEATKYTGDRSGKNAQFVDAVARTNVQLTVEAIRKNSPILAGLEKEGKIKIVGSMYDLTNGMLTFMA